jgi:hypothetical protein
VPPARCASTAEASGLLPETDVADGAIELAITGLISSYGSSGLEQKTALRALGLSGPVIVCGDADVTGTSTAVSPP